MQEHHLKIHQNNERNQHCIPTLWKPGKTLIWESSNRLSDPYKLHIKKYCLILGDINDTIVQTDCFLLAGVLSGLAWDIPVLLQSPEVFGTYYSAWAPCWADCHPLCYSWRIPFSQISKVSKSQQVFKKLNVFEMAIRCQCEDVQSYLYISMWGFAKWILNGGNTFKVLSDCKVVFPHIDRAL